MKLKLKSDQGVAGLTILLSVVTMLFVIGLLVMIFALMGGELQDATYTDTTVTVTNETNTYINATGDTLAGGNTANILNSDTYVLTAIWGVDVGVYNITVPIANATVTSAGVITNATIPAYANASVSYTYHYDASNTATDVMNDTTANISTVTDWFSIFLVITAMVVLILLTVIIITAIRGSGLIDSGA